MVQVPVQMLCCIVQKYVKVKACILRNGLDPEAASHRHSCVQVVALACEARVSLLLNDKYQVGWRPACTFTSIEGNDQTKSSLTIGERSSG